MEKAFKVQMLMDATIIPGYKVAGVESIKFTRPSKQSRVVETVHAHIFSIFLVLM
jgi:hypothetical protein